MIPHLKRNHENFIEVSVLEDVIGSKEPAGFPSGYVTQRKDGAESYVNVI